MDVSLLDKMNALIQENKTYNCMILSDNGIVFKNREGTTTLTASVTAPGADLTDKFAITWKKDGSEIGYEKSIVVSAADIVGKAVYRFEAMEGEKLRGSYEVTVSNVDDGEKQEAPENLIIHGLSLRMTDWGMACIIRTASNIWELLTIREP